MTYFDKLVQSGVPIDWTTIKVGREILYCGSPLVIREQIVEYAMDRFDTCGPDEPVWVSVLAYTFADDVWRIDACLDVLAENAPEAIERAKRVWRWLLMEPIVSSLERDAASMPRKPEPYQDMMLDELAFDLSYELRRLWDLFADIPDDEAWRHLVDPHDDPVHILPTALLRAHHEWLDAQEIWLRNGSRKRRQLGPNTKYALIVN